MRLAGLLACSVLVLTSSACDAKPAAKGAEAEKTAQAEAEKTEAKASETPEAATADPKPVPSDARVDQTVKLLDGSDKNLADYRGKALLVVNTASQCGFTPQYAELQQLYATYKDKGLEVLAFPSNDFGGQEPLGPEEIRKFVDAEFNVEFEMFDKVTVAGDDKTPLYKTLTEDTGEGIAGEINWNFTKFLVDPEGRVVARFEPPVTPLDPKLTAAIEGVLPK